MTKPGFRGTPYDRFASKFTVDQASGCWVWGANKNKGGYGFFAPDGKHTILAHRASWVLCGGCDPGDLNVCHHCDNPSCVNPAHLFLGTQLENLQDAARKNRIRSGTRHHSAKLTEADVVSIRADSRPRRDIAKAYGVSRNTVCLILRRLRWKRVA